MAPDIDDPVCFIHQIVPRSLHDLVAKLRQETARADILGDSGNPILVIGVVVELVGQGGSHATALPLRFLVEGQDAPLWKATDLHGRIKGTPAEAVLFQTLRTIADGEGPFGGWTPPAALALPEAGRVSMTVLGSLSVLVHPQAGDGQAADGTGPARCLACLQEARTEMETLELPLRAASDFRRFQALTPGLRRAEVDFAGLEPVAPRQP